MLPPGADIADIPKPEHWAPPSVSCTGSLSGHLLLSGTSASSTSNQAEKLASIECESMKQLASSLIRLCERLAPIKLSVKKQPEATPGTADFGQPRLKNDPHKNFSVPMLTFSSQSHLDQKQHAPASEATTERRSAAETRDGEETERQRHSRLSVHGEVEEQRATAGGIAREETKDRPGRQRGWESPRNSSVLESPRSRYTFQPPNNQMVAQYPQDKTVGEDLVQ